jgi:hypothetical protein
VFHRFRQAKFAYGGLILSSSQFMLLLLWPLKMILAIKVVKIDSKIITLLPQSKLVKQTVETAYGVKLDMAKGKNLSKQFSY